jgi:PAS domain-containing protein
MKKLNTVFKENLVMVSMITLMILILVGATFTWLNKREIIKTTQLKTRAEEVKQRMDMIFSVTLRQVDLGLRGYALTKSEQLLNPMMTAIRSNEVNLEKLDSLLRIQKLDTSIAKFNEIRKGIDDYVAFSKQMKNEAEQDSMKVFLEMLNQDKGYDLWRLFEPFLANHLVYEDAQILKAQMDYEAALNRNIIIQIILVLLGIPSLGFVIFITRKELKDRRNLLIELEENNRKFLFDPGTELTVKNPKEVIENSIGNFKKASEFVKGITSKNYEVQWDGLDKSNSVKNTNNLAGELVKMRDQMIVARQEDERRFWMNEGLTKFSQLVRNHQANLTKLSEEATRFLAQYLNAQQGSLFVLNDETETDTFLELAACYAFDKKKYIEKRIEIGNGMVGQAYLEGQAIVLKEVPSDYVQITSGLGHATPTCLCIIPLKYNDKTEAVLELASFQFVEPYQMDFLEKAGEFVASAIIGAKVSARMKVLLDQSQQQSEVMHAQEEEMRQNMEELQATQEEMERKGRELEGMLSKSNEKEEELKMKLSEIETIKKEDKQKNDELITYMQNYKTTLLGILDQLPHKVFLKDKDGKMALVNTIVAKAHNMSVDELIGKSDFDFVDAKTAQDWRNQELAIIKKGSETYIFDEALHGETKTLKSTKMAFYIPHLNQTGLLGIQTDITELQELKRQAEQHRS